MIYLLADKLWKIFKWIWLSVIVVLILGIAANLAVVPTNSFSTLVIAKVLILLFNTKSNGVLTISLAAFFILVTLVSGIISKGGDYLKSGSVLRKYLNVIIETNQGLNPKGFSQQSQALISVNVPLDDIFIHLNAVSDRPVYDVPGIQEELLNHIRQRADLTAEEREERVQRLRVIWHSQLGQKLAEVWHKQNIAIEQVLGQLKLDLPVAVILGPPGSGKSTVMRWLALQMARASLSRKYALPTGLIYRQVPIFLRISDFAKRLSVENLSFEQFFREQYSRIHPDLPKRLLEELAKGHCLILLDGLDEVASDSLRRLITQTLYSFIFEISTKKLSTTYFNRIVVTSRIIGYEPGPFNKYGHFTLVDLEDKQIKQFLDNWCPAVERYQAMAAQGMKPLTLQQQEQATLAGYEQRDRLIHALENSPSIKRLSVNPLMLTILALIQRSGRTLPHRRVDLYQTVTRTLLDNWNQDTGRKMFTIDEVTLAEQLLGKLAFSLHGSGPVLTEKEVKKISHQVMTEYYGKVNDNTIQEFIETLRSSSGLFVESGQGLFSFMHRTFQEYFVALYLLNLLPQELTDFIKSHYSKAIWREPLLLTIAYKSGQSSGEERRQASELIQSILSAGKNYDAVLQRHILFAASCIVDCGAWSIDKGLQQNIATNLFDIYGDYLNRGRYKQLQREIEDATLLWLHGQPDISSQQGFWSPFIESWRIALSNKNLPLRQEGAVHLLAAISSDMQNCPSPVLLALIPPLLHLADLKEFPCPREITQLLQVGVALPSSPKVEEYAYVALRMLDALGPAGWLHSTWVEWSRNQPELLKRLSHHTNELNYLLSPTALAAKSTSQNWQIQYKMSQEPQSLHQTDLQAQMLNASDTARYPHAYFMKQALDQEIFLSAKPNASFDWRDVWNVCLQRELVKGRIATYQSCRNLQILLYKGNTSKRQLIVEELMRDLLEPAKRYQASNLITSIYLHYLLDQLDPKDLRKMQDLQGLLELLELHYLIDMRDMFDIRYIREMLDLRDLREPLYILYLQKLLDPKYLSHVRYLSDLRFLINRDALIDSLCYVLNQRISMSTSATLLTLYSVIASDRLFSAHFKSKVENTLNRYLQKIHLITQEHRLIATSIMRLFSSSKTQTTFIAELNVAPDNLALSLYSLKQKKQIDLNEVQLVLRGCNDLRKLSKDRQSQMQASTVQEVAWNLVNQGLIVETAAFPLIAQALGGDALSCAAAALLLQSNKKLPENIRQESSGTIMRLLSDDELSHRLLDPPDYTKIWRLDNILFETLKMLVE